MPLHSIWGTSTPPGAGSTANDGETVTLSNWFYLAGSTGTWSCVGVRFFVDAAALPMPALTFKAWASSESLLTTTPDRQVDGVTVVAGWNEVRWATPLPIVNGQVFQVGYTTPNKYLTRPSPGTDWIRALDNAPFYLHEGSRGRFHYASGPQSPSQLLWGVDALVDDGLGTPGPAHNGTAALTGSGGLGVATTPRPAPAVPLTGTGSLSAGTAGSSSSTAALSGTGTLTAPARTPGVARPAQLGGTGALTAAKAGARTIAAENALTAGVMPRDWWHDGLGSTQMPAFARSSYYRPGQTAQLSVDYNAPFNVEFWRLGWYGGAGARRLATTAGTPTNQPDAVVIPDSNGATTCAAWAVNASWSIPADATPGWYTAVLKGTNGTDYGAVLFCVSDADARRPILVVGSEATWGAAYNYYGTKSSPLTGKSLYGSGGPIGGTTGATGRALCVSYDRPVVTREGVAQTHFFNGEYAQLRMLERFGYEVGYTTCEQIDADPSIMDGRAVVVFSGHNEYNSQRMRDKTAQVIRSGTHVVNLSANDFFWRTRYGTTDGADTVTRGRVMWCRKDTMPGPGSHVAGTPFVSHEDWGGTWQDTRWPLRQPSSDLLGDRFIANGIRADRIEVPAAMKSWPLWRHCTDVPGSGTYAFGAGSLGMEWDMPEGPSRRREVSSTTVDLTIGGASDINGENYDRPGVFTHAMTMGIGGHGHGWVFNANTTQWGWLMDNFHDRGVMIASNDAVQATVNVLADFGMMPDPAAAAAVSTIVVPDPVGDLFTAYGIEPYGAPSTGTATLSGSGSLAATGAPTRAASVALAGSGSLGAVAAPRPAVGVALTGSGSLSAGTAGQGASTTVALTGAGALTALARLTAPGTAALTGAGSLTAAGVLSGVGVALTGAGALAAAARPAVTRTVQLTGAGSLTTAGSSTHDPIPATRPRARITSRGGYAVLSPEEA